MKGLDQKSRKASRVPDVFSDQNFFRELLRYMRLTSYPVGIELSQLLTTIQSFKISKKWLSFLYYSCKNYVCGFDSYLLKQFTYKIGFSQSCLNSIPTWAHVEIVIRSHQMRLVSIFNQSRTREVFSNFRSSPLVRNLTKWRIW